MIARGGSILDVDKDKDMGTHKEIEEQPGSTNPPLRPRGSSRRLVMEECHKAGLTALPSSVSQTLTTSDQFPLKHFGWGDDYHCGSKTQKVSCAERHQPERYCNSHDAFCGLWNIYWVFVILFGLICSVYSVPEYNNDYNHILELKCNINLK